MIAKVCDICGGFYHKDTERPEVKIDGNMATLSQIDICYRHENSTATFDICPLCSQAILNTLKSREGCRVNKYYKAEEETEI